MDEWALAEQNHKFISSEKWEVAVLPFGATEPHNYHLPYSTDTLEGETIGRRICQYAYERGAKVLLLPAIPFGVNTNHMQIPGGMAISMRPTTLLKILTDVVESLEAHGVRKLLILNSHGGNELKPFMRELYGRTKVFMCLCDWYRMASDQFPSIFEQPADHADEMETSLALAFFPQYVRMEQAGPGRAKPAKIDAIQKGWVSITRPWHLLTEDTGVGNPSAATPEKGHRLMKIIVARLGQFLYDLAQAPLDDHFPF